MAGLSKLHDLDSDNVPESISQSDEMFRDLYNILNTLTINHTLLSATHTDSVAATAVRGDLITAQISGGATVWERLGIGASAGQVLRSNGSDPLWSSFTIPDTFAAGDVIYASAANVLTALAKDTNATRYLSNTGASNVPAWAQVDLSNGVTGTLFRDHGGLGNTGQTTGDLLYGDTSVSLTWSRLGIGTTMNKLLQSQTIAGSKLPQWTNFTFPLDIAQGDVLYGSASEVISALAKSATATRYLANTGASNSPAWDRINLANGVIGLLALANGGTGADLSATGGASQVLKQTSVGGAVTVAQLAASDLSNGTTGSGAVVLATSPALLSSPTAPTQATSDNSTKLATTAFVTTAVANAIAGVNPAVAVQAATAAVLPNTPTYSNGVSGIGATLTASVTNTALVVDGYTPALLERVLVKNQASAFQNGVYYVSQVAAVGLAWVLTRAVDYDTPSDMNNTGAIPVSNGSVNLDTSWVQTSQVTTVGTDAVTFTQFSLNPTTIVVGPASATNLDIAVFDGTSGKLIKDGSATIASLKNALLDGTNHTDTAAGAVARGDTIIGNSTPKWARLAIGANGTFLSSDGTDVSWAAPTAGAAGSDKQVQFNDGGTALAGNSKFTFDKTTGTLLLNGLFDLTSASAGQIAFPATQNASSGANTLDDFEEGSWTPTLKTDAGPTEPSNYTTAGRYVKIGKLVVVWFQISLTTKGATFTAAGGNLYIGGYPFTVENVTSPLNIFGVGALSSWANMGTSWCYQGLRVDTNATLGYLLGVKTAASTGVTFMVPADTTDSSFWIGFAVYRATA